MMPDSFEFLNIISLNIFPFLLIVTRLGIVFFTIPPFKQGGFPNLIKVLITLAFSLIVLPVLSVKIDIKTLSFLEIFYYISIEFLIGLLISFVISIVFIAVEVAGNLIDFNSGFGFASVIDPLTQQNTTLTSKFYLLISIVIFFIINGHSLLISAVVESYKKMPLGFFKINQDLINFFIKCFSSIFMIGLKIAAPIIATLFITEVSLAVLARAIPQLNVFLVGFSLKIAILFIFLSVMLINTVPYLQGLFEDSFLTFKGLFALFKIA